MKRLLSSNKDSRSKGKRDWNFLRTRGVTKSKGLLFDFFIYFLFIVYIEK